MGERSLSERKPKRSIPVTRQLSKAYGGTWRHIGFTGTWERTDEDGWYLRAVSAGCDEFDNPFPWRGRVILYHPHGEPLDFYLGSEFPKIKPEANHE